MAAEGEAPAAEHSSDGGIQKHSSQLTETAGVSKDYFLWTKVVMFVIVLFDFGMFYLHNFLTLQANQQGKVGSERSFKCWTWINQLTNSSLTQRFKDREMMGFKNFTNFQLTKVIPKAAQKVTVCYT